MFVEEQRGAGRQDRRESGEKPKTRGNTNETGACYELREKAGEDNRGQHPKREEMKHQ
jgi:hypothetical protein